jgi:hypothetical protein
LLGIWTKKERPDLMDQIKAQNDKAVADTTPQTVPAKAWLTA